MAEADSLEESPNPPQRYPVDLANGAHPRRTSPTDIHPSKPATADFSNEFAPES